MELKWLAKDKLRELKLLPEFVVPLRSLADQLMARETSRVK